MLKQAFYILFFYFTGEFISSFIDGFIPGSVIGMILLFLALVFKLVKPANVKKLSTILTENMGLFFLPAGVGLMTSLGVISQYWAVILTASVVSTILVIASVALIQQNSARRSEAMNNLAQSEVFSLTLVIGTYMAALALYKKTRISLLHPLLTSILVIIAVLKMMGIEYESFQRGSHLIHFLLGPSVVALGFVLYEQMQYLKGNVISILTSVFVGAIIGIVSVIVIGDLMGADQALIATLQPKSVTTPIAMGIAEKAGGMPSLTAVIVVAVGIFGSIVGPFVMKVLGIESRIAKGLALGASSHGLGTSVAIQIGAVEGALSGLAIGLMGIMTAILVPVISFIISLF